MSRGCDYLLIPLQPCSALLFPHRAQFAVPEVDFYRGSGGIKVTVSLLASGTAALKPPNTLKRGLKKKWVYLKAFSLYFNSSQGAGGMRQSWQEFWKQTGFFLYLNNLSFLLETWFFQTFMAPLDFLKVLELKVTIKFWQHKKLCTWVSNCISRLSLRRFGSH